jgi:hypothetical protein
MYNKYGFDKNWIHHLTKRNYNKRWFRPDKFNVYTIATYGGEDCLSDDICRKECLYDQDGFDIDGYNKDWFRCDWIHKETWTMYNKHWFDMFGYDEKKLDKYGNPPEKEYVIIYNRCHVCSGTWFVRMRWAHHQSWDKQSDHVMCINCKGWGRVEIKRIEVHV